jgi:hypothetical protein
MDGTVDASAQSGRCTVMIEKLASRSFRHSLRLALLTVAIGGAGEVSLAASPSCTQLGAVPELRASPGDTAAATATITIPRGVEGLALQDIRTLAGACREDVVGFELSLVFLRKGRQVVIEEGGGVSPVREALSSGRFMAIKQEENHPVWDKGEFVMATRVDTRRFPDGSVTESFIGVWKRRKASTVGVFRRGPDGAFSPPSVLLTSSLPILSVSYFPAPDAASGRVGITQEAPEGLRLVNAGWFHPNLMK